MSDLKKGQAIKWTAKDAQGEFTHVGVIVSVKGDRVEFVTEQGMFNVGVKDGAFESAKMTAKLKELAAAKETVQVEKVSTATVHSAPKAKRERKARGEGPSKKDQAQTIYNELRAHGRDVIVQRFIDVLGMTKSGANTYFYNCKKAAGE